MRTETARTKGNKCNRIWNFDEDKIKIALYYSSILVFSFLFSNLLTQYFIESRYRKKYSA